MSKIKIQDYSSYILLGDNCEANKILYQLFSHKVCRVFKDKKDIATKLNEDLTGDALWKIYEGIKSTDELTDSLFIFMYSAFTLDQIIKTQLESFGNKFENMNTVELKEFNKQFRILEADQDLETSQMQPNEPLSQNNQSQLEN